MLPRRELPFPVTDADPLVTIGLPIYNEERTLARALDSLLEQDYRNFEIVICDNASTDRTAEICAGYLSDSRIRYYRNETNVGGIANFNRVFELSRGEFFMWASGHDVRHPSFTSRALELMRDDESIVLCHSQVLWTAEGGGEPEPIPSFVDTRGVSHEIARLNVVLWGLVTGYPIYGLIRSSALRRTDVYREVVSPDITLLGELALLGEFAFIPEPMLSAPRPTDNWQIYVKKHMSKPLSPWSAQVLYWRMVGELCRATRRHPQGIRHKAVGTASVLLCMLTKYHWMLLGMLSLRRRR